MTERPLNMATADEILRLKDQVAGLLAQLDQRAWSEKALRAEIQELTAAAETREAQLLREFVGFLSADVPELHRVEVPWLGQSVDRFLAQVLTERK